MVRFFCYSLVQILDFGFIFCQVISFPILPLDLRLLIVCARLLTNNLFVCISFLSLEIFLFCFKRFDVHMMVSNPAKWLEPMSNAGIDQFTFHLESMGDDASAVNSLIDRVKKAKLRCGLSIKPKTPVSFDFLNPKNPNFQIFRLKNFSNLCAKSTAHLSCNTFLFGFHVKFSRK